MFDGVGDLASWIWNVVSNAFEGLWDWLWGVASDATLDEVGDVLGVAASAAAVVAFVYWILEQRRRPEVRFMWSFSPTGKVDDLMPWDHAEERTAPPGATVLVEASLQNVGDGATQGAQTNFVLPDAVKCESAPSWGDPKQAVKVAGKPFVFLHGAFPLPPGDYQLQRFRLRVPNDEGRHPLTFNISDARLNASGSRLWYSRLVGGDLPDPKAGAPWPPPLPKHRWSRIRAQPEGRVACMRGVRADVRDLVVKAPMTEP